MLMGVFCTVDSRFSAVTTISSSAVVSFAVSATVCANAGPRDDYTAAMQATS